MENEEVKRYNMNLPSTLYEELYNIAEQEHTSVSELLRKFIKLGFVAMRIERDPDAKIIIRDVNGDRELLIL